MKRVAALVLALVVCVGGAYALAPHRRVESTDARPALVSARPAPRDGLSWIVAGGGPTPSLNQVQIEQDVRHASELFVHRGEGLVLFGGGRRGRSVQELSGNTPTGLHAALGDLLDPRPGRDAVYRASTLAPDGPVSRQAILAALEGALSDGTGPLTLYLAGHGMGGEFPRESRFETWGADALWVEDLAETLDAFNERPVRMIVTSCYGGGFAELAFRGADVDAGPAETPRCGFFATDWDRVASGCDPNPDRGAQEGYGLHFLHALSLEDRHGRPDASIDLDRDGRVSMLEAHTRARIASGSLDLPVTTSEVFLRAAVEEGTDAVPLSSREEDAVIRALSRQLALEDEDAALARRDALFGELETRGEALDRLELEVEAAREDYGASVLHRWPELGDPWHPAFASTLDEASGEIQAFLDASSERARHASLSAQQAQLAEDHDRTLVALAPVERLLRAYETRRLAGALRNEGGAFWLRYQAFLACERGDW
ncbi:MAG: hypothetical protein AB8I08_35090 [Sandaracinaceae bacterium]